MTQKKQLWRCSKRRSKNCKSACRIIDGALVTPPTEHSHLPLSLTEITKVNITNDIKKKAVENPDEKPLKLISNSIKNTQTMQLLSKDIYNMRKMVYRKKRSVFKRLPITRKECIRELKSMSLADDELVRSVKGNIVLIARKEDLQLLNKENIMMFCDGTFNYAPRFFKQMLNIFVMDNGNYIPVCHFILVNKAQKTYNRALKMLIEECQKNGFSLKNKMKSSSVMLDFEQALINSFKWCFPSCTIKGCGFHLGQSWWRKIKELGLAPEYRNRSSQEGRWLRGLFGLPLVPNIMTKQVFDDYCKTRTGKSAKLGKMKTYLKNTYISQKALFEPSMWADIEGPKTNNCAEAFHRHFGDLFGYLKTKPPIWQFLRNLSVFNKMKSIKMNSSNVRRINSDESYSIICEFLKKKINVSTMLTKLSFRNKPKCVLRRKKNEF